MEKPRRSGGSRKQKHGSGKRSARWGPPLFRSQQSDGDGDDEAPPLISSLSRVALSSPNLAAMALGPSAVDDARQPSDAKKYIRNSAGRCNGLANGRALNPKSKGTTGSTKGVDGNGINKGKSIFRSFHASYEMDMGSALGTGGYAVVRQARHRKTGGVVAVKIMSLGRGDSNSGSDSDSDSSDSSDSGSESSHSDDDKKTHSQKYNMTMSFDEVMNEIEMVRPSIACATTVPSHGVDVVVAPASLLLPF